LAAVIPALDEVDLEAFFATGPVGSLFEGLVDFMLAITKAALDFNDGRKVAHTSA